MRITPLARLRPFPAWAGIAVWFAVFLSPTGYVLLSTALSRWQMPVPPAWFVVALFCLIPVVALLVCVTMVWRSEMSRGGRVGWVVLTVLTMLLQFGVWVVTLIGLITVAISPAQ